MPQGIKTLGFNLLTGKRTLDYMARKFGYQVVGVLQNYAAPAGYVPQPSDDESKGYGPGSEIVTVDGLVYKCYNATKGDAKWVQLAIVLENVEQGAEAKQKPSGGDQSLPEDVPFRKFLVDGGVTSVGKLRELINQGKLVEVSYINQERADKIRDFLQV